MIKNLNKTTTTTIIGIITILACFGFFYLSGLGLSKATDALQTQINQGLFGIIMLVIGYYFGSSKDKDNKK